MCNPMCATAARLAELEAENARLREARLHVECLLLKAVRDEYGVKMAWALSRGWQWPEDAPSAVHATLEEARAWLATPTQQEARDAG